MEISFIAAACEQVRLRNGCCALSAISVPRAGGTDQWGTWHEAVTPEPPGSIWQSCWNGALHSQGTGYKLFVQATASYFMGLTNALLFWRTITAVLLGQWQRNSKWRHVQEGCGMHHWGGFLNLSPSSCCSYSSSVAFLLLSCLIQVWWRGQWELGWGQRGASEAGVGQLLQETDEPAQSELGSVFKGCSEGLLWACLTAIKASCHWWQLIISSWCCLLSFTSCTSAFVVFSTFWSSPIIERNAAYSCAGFSAVLNKRSLLFLMPMVVVKTDFPIQLLLNIPIAELNFWLWFSFFVFLALFWHIFNGFITSALIFPGAGI